MVAPGPDALLQSLQHHVPFALGVQPEEQGQHAGRLGDGDFQRAVGLEVLLQESGLDCFAQLLILLLVLPIAQGLGGLGCQAGGVVVERRGGVGQAGGAKGVLGVAVLPVQGQPVAQLAAPQPQAPAAVSLVVLADALHPGLHHGVLLPQQRQIAVVLVDGPGHHGGHVAPDGAAVRAAAEPEGAGLVGRLGGGHKEGHRALVIPLFLPHVVEEVVEEGGHVQIFAGGGGDDGRVAGPAQALVPLGAVGGDVQEVVKLPPHGVVEQLVDPAVRRLNGAGGVDVRADVHPGKVLRPHLGDALHLHIAEAVEGAVGPHMGLFSLGDIPVLRLGGAQVVPVEAAVLEHLAVGEHNLRARGLAYVKLHPAGHVLAKVQHGFAPLGVEHRGGEAGLLHDLGPQAGHELFQLLRAGEDAAGLGLAAVLAPAGDFQPGVVVLAVVDVAEGDRGGVAFPAQVRGDGHLGAVLQLHPDFADGLHGVAVQIVVPVEDDVPLVPAGGQGQAHGVFPGPQQPGDVEGLVLQVEVVAVVARQQVLVPGLLAVDFQFVDAHAAGVGPGAFHLSGEGEALGQQGLGLLVGEVRGNPLGGPGLLLLGGLKPGGGSGGVAAVAPHGDGPLVAGAGLQLHRRLKAQGGHILPPAAVVDDLRAGFHHDLGAGLALVGGVLRHPGKNRPPDEKPQGLGDMVGAKMGQFQNDSSIPGGLPRPVFIGCPLSSSRAAGLLLLPRCPLPPAPVRLDFPAASRTPCTCRRGP